MKTHLPTFIVILAMTVSLCFAQGEVLLKDNSLVTGVQLFPDGEPDGYRGKALKVNFTAPLERNRKLAYTMTFTSKSGHVYKHQGSFHTSFSSSKPKSFQLVNLYLSVGRYDPPEKRAKLKSEIVPGNIKTMKMVVVETVNGIFSTKKETLVDHTFKNL